MPNIVEITDLSAPELDVYARLTQAQLRNRLEPEKAYPQGRPGQPEAHHDLPAPGPVDHHRGDPPGHRGPCALRPGPGGHGWPVSAGAERWHCTQSPGRSGQVCQLPPEYATYGDEGERLSALYPARLLRVHQD